MKLIDIINECEDGYEVTVWDKDYDMEVYFYHNDDPDEWDKAMNKIAEKLEVVDMNSNGVTVNLYDVIERNIDNGVFETLFRYNDVDSIMEDMENILAGYVSEKWLTKFADSLI